MAGRRPKPTHLRLVEGNPGKRPLNAMEPKPRREKPSAPAHLSGRAKAAWGTVSVILDRMGLLTEADGLALEGLCEAYADVLEARAALKLPVTLTGEDDVITIAEAGKLTYVTVGKGGPMIRNRPEVALLADADRRLKSWLVEFGLTPAARSKVHASDDAKEQDPLDAYL